jgi:hypothetical protein
MKEATFIAAGALYFIAMTLAYWNRSSEKVLTTLLLGLFALIGSIWAVMVFSAESPMQKAFSVPIIIHADTRLPVENLPYPVLPTGFAVDVREKLLANPELLQTTKTDPFAQGVYHHVLQRAIIYWLESKYPVTWQVDTFPMTLGEISGFSARSKDVPSRVFLPAELKALMSGNEFAEIGAHGNSDKFGLAVPPGTQLIVSTPNLDPARGAGVSSIKMRNEFCTITIDVSSGMSTVGASTYGLALGMSEDQAQRALSSNSFVVVISVTFSRLRTAHPEMPSYKKWATEITNGLESQFSDQIVWSKTKESLLFRRAAGF